MKTGTKTNNSRRGLLSAQPGRYVARMCTALLAGTTLWLTALTTTHAANYQLDNSSISTALNASEGTEPLDDWFGNVFTAQAGGNMITSVGFGVFTTTPSSAGSVVLYKVTDPGGNPALGATRVYTQAFTPLTGDNTNAFLQSISLTTPITFNPGDRFLVAVLIRNVIAAPPNDVYPYLLDTSGVAAGSYWDRSAPNTFNLDNLSLAKLVNLPLTPGGFAPGAGHIFIRATGVAPSPPGSIQLSPAFATNLVGQVHTVCATLHSFGPDGTNVIVGTTVTFNVTNGPNAGVNATSVTDTNGVACFSYTGLGGIGTDLIDASFVDATGARRSATATKVWVSANHPPVAVCTNVTVSADSSNCTANASIDGGSFDSDTNDVITITQIPPGPYPLGSNVVVLLVVDNHGASNACVAAVTVVDDTPPDLACPTSITQTNDPGQCSAVVNFVVSASDCGGILDLSCDVPSGTAFPVGTNYVTCTAVDLALNTNTCTFAVIIQDNEPPVVGCRPAPNPSGKKIPVSGKNPSSGQNPDGYYQVLAKDNCDPNPQIYIHDLGSSFVAGPFNSGDIVKLKQNPGGTPTSAPGNPPIVAEIHLNGDAIAYAVDASGNVSPDGCYMYIPPKPK